MPKRLARSVLTAATLTLALTLVAPAQTQGPLETTSLLGRKLFAQPENSTITVAKANIASGSHDAGP